MVRKPRFTFLRRQGIFELLFSDKKLARKGYPNEANTIIDFRNWRGKGIAGKQKEYGSWDVGTPLKLKKK